jgi:hypothetical protein
MTRFFPLPRWTRVLGLLLLVIVACLLVAPAGLAQDIEPEGLVPGEIVTYRQTVPVNIVFVGFEQADIDVAAVRAELPASYEPIVRYPPFYGLEGRDMGLRFDFDYRPVFTDQAFEDDFFGYLASIATPGDPTLFQQLYNGMNSNVVDVTGPVGYIDGPTAEQWLMTAGEERLGINPDKSYTIYYINWYDRPDFQFHVYTKTDSPDPDTGYNFGLLRQTRKMVAWGGSHGRTWFYDLSAGPDYWTGNYDVDNEDFDGDGYADYRIPSVWEYTAGGFRDPAALSSDLGLVTRYVGINLLFTTSPLYDPLVAAPGPDGQRVAQIELFNLHRLSNAADWIDMDMIQAEYESFQPYYDWQFVLDNNRRPAPAGVRRAIRIGGGLSTSEDCWVDYGTPFAQYFCFFDANYDRFVPEYGPQDYVAAVFGFNGADRNLGGVPLGFADDNWRDGTQSYVFMFTGPEIRSAGYGFTTTAIHELGHHFGLSHPHDGYDSATGVDYGPGGDFFFVNVGDEVNSMMSYIDVGWSFGQFDRDNMYRYEFAGYLNLSNEMLDDVLAHPDRATVRDLVAAGREHAKMAERAFRQWDYLTAVTHARMAYEAIATAADTLGLPMAAAAAETQAPINGTVPRFIDPIR